MRVLMQSDPVQLLGPTILVFAGHTKQFKDSNFNVLKATLAGIKALLEATQASGPAKGNSAAVSIVLAPAVEKLGDRKLQVPLVWILFDSCTSCNTPSRGCDSVPSSALARVYYW